MRPSRPSRGTNTRFGLFGRMSVCFIGNTTSEDQFMDTLAHELYHVHNAISEYYAVSPDGEDAAWTMGFLMRQAVRMIYPSEL